MKFAFVSHVLPPSWSGQAVVIYRLLKELNPKDYCLISHGDGAAPDSRGESTELLKAHYYSLPPPREKRLGGRLGLNRGFVNIPVNIVSRAREIARIIQREKCKAIVACTGDFYDLPASYLASRWTRIPFYPYIFDYYSQQWTEQKSRRIAKRFEPIMMKGAAGIIAPNEFMRDELRHRYNVEAAVIRNCCDLSAYESSTSESVSDAHDALETKNGDRHEDLSADQIKIVYTGALSEAQIEVFRNLMRALELLDRPKVKLHLYTAQSPSALSERGIDGPIVFHKHVTAFEIPKIQREADVLFLPLAFDSPYPLVIKTSAPGKMADYLAAGGPILVNAPRDSFVAWYFRKHGCGLVVDEDDPAKLADGLERLLVDRELRLNLRTRAIKLARSEFSDAVSRARFAQLLKLESVAGSA